MVLYTNSKGILAKQDFIKSIFETELRYLNAKNHSNRDSVFVGWGQKSNTKKIKQKAQELSLPYWQLEDGFIGYIGHPAKGGTAVSLIADALGIYYDARQPSQLEHLIVESVDTALLSRAELLIADIVRLGITKYNCYAHNTEHTLNDFAPVTHTRLARVFDDQRPRILLVDQVAGDLSIPGALASEADFVAMVEEARQNHPYARLLLRTHPDTRLGKKSGVLARLVGRDPRLADVEVVSELSHPHRLIRMAEAVYTVSSQVGFEALLLGKPVYCFGMPFYAGWGLTHDSKRCMRREKAMSAAGISTIALPRLVAAALIRYPRYLDPIVGKRCEVEDVVAILAQQQVEPSAWRRLYLVGFSLWKRTFMRTFCAHLADELCFVRTAPSQLKDDEQVLVWGNRYPEQQSVIRVEDGFIRSNGLGSNLCRPSSLSIDPVGIYFDSRRPSRLEQLLNSHSVDAKEESRSEALLAQLQASRVSKYNVGVNQDYSPPQDGRELVLVVGQVDGDASILCGSPVIRSNEQLLWAVREAKPNAHILFKPHPDVVSGNREGAISARCLDHCVDSQVLDIGLDSLFAHIDELHTMTSLSGFEALVQGVKVTTWGKPFYSGWGLTYDRHPPARRQRTLALSTLVYITLAKYPRYIDWQSGLWCSPEQLIALLAVQKNATAAAVSRWQRWRIKWGYLVQTLKPRRSLFP